MNSLPNRVFLDNQALPDAGLANKSLAGLQGFNFSATHRDVRHSTDNDIKVLSLVPVSNDHSASWHEDFPQIDTRSKAVRNRAIYLLLLQKVFF